MRPLLLHASSPAASPGHRRVLHVESAAAGLPGGLQWYEAPSAARPLPDKAPIVAARLIVLP